MRKNKMMRLASALLVAVLLTTCAISGTFAKYVESATGSDSARVAKWGVEITANGETFTTTETGTVAGASANTVLSGGGDVVAPGMSGNMVSMGLTGIPEVAVKVTYSATIEFGDKWTDEGAVGSMYLPLVIYINGAAYTAVGAGCATPAEFATFLQNQIAAYSREYEAGTDLSTVGTDSLEISWEWPFSTSTENDINDTYLGEQAALGNAATVSITVTTTVTQID